MNIISIADKHDNKISASTINIYIYIESSGIYLEDHSINYYSLSKYILHI